MKDTPTCSLARAANSLFPSRGRPRAEDVGQVETRILDAAWAVLLDVGPEVLTLDKVAATARASKQTIYARYSGKRALFQAVLERRVEVALTGLDVLPDLPTAHAAFADLLARVVVSHSQPEKLIFDRMIDWIDTSCDASGQRPTLVWLHNRFRTIIEQHLVSAVERWELPIADCALAAEFWIDGVIGHLRASAGTDLQAWVCSYTEYYLRGVAGIEPG